MSVRRFGALLILAGPTGDIDGRLAPDRLESYRKIQAELRHLATRQDALAQQTEKKQTRTIHRAMRKMPPKR